VGLTDGAIRISQERVACVIPSRVRCSGFACAQQLPSSSILKFRLNDMIERSISRLTYRPAIWRFMWQNQQINSRQEIIRLQTQRENIIFALNVVNVSDEQRAQLYAQLSSVKEQLVLLAGNIDNPANLSTKSGAT
jgi:hypothetical protein